MDPPQLPPLFVQEQSPMVTEPDSIKRPLSPESLPSPDAKRHRSHSDQQLLRNYDGNILEDFKAAQHYSYRIHETLPRIPSAHPNFEDVLRLIDQAVDVIFAAANSGPDSSHDLELSTLLFHLANKGQVSFGNTPKVVVVGDTGAGKSSFLNVFLEQDLANAGDSGNACTQVITEFVDKRDTATINVQVQFKTKATLAAEVRAHFMSYVKHALGDEDQEDEEGVVQWKVDTIGTSRKFFTQLLGARSDFDSEEAFESFMSGLSTEDYDSTISELQQLCESEISPRFSDSERRIVDIPLQTAEQIPFALKEYTDLQSEGKVGLWPAVELVRLGLDSPLLRQGFTISDAPGLSDSNAVRKSTTERYLRSCSIVIVLGECKRILDSPSIRNYLKTYIGQVGGSRVILLPTKCEDVKQSPKTNLTPAEQEKLEELERLSENSEKELKDAVAKERSGIKIGKAELEDIRQRKVMANHTLQRQRALVRNGVILRSLRRSCKKNAFGRGSKQLSEIIPISSDTQAIFNRGMGAMELPILTLSETGIAAVRAAVCRIALSGQLNVVERHLNVNLQHAVNKLDIALSKTPRERIGQLLGKIEEHRKAVSSSFDGYQRSLWDQFQIAVTSKIPQKWRNDKAPWAMHVKGLTDGWQVKFKSPNTFKAFCRRHGVHRPGGSGEQCDWNHDILKVPLEDVVSMLDVFAEDLQLLKAVMLEDVLRMIDTMRENIQDDSNLGSRNEDALWDNFRICRGKLEHSLVRYFKRFEEDVRLKFDDVLSAYQRSPFLNAMDKVYDNMMTYKSDKKGRNKGSKTACEDRYDTFYQQIMNKRGNGPFVALEKSLETAFEEVLNAKLKELHGLITEPFDSFQDDVKLMFVGDDSKDYLPREQRELMKNAVAEAMPEFKMKIELAKKLLREVKVWYEDAEGKEAMA